MDFKPYLNMMRLKNPIGVWLLMFPGWWGLSLAASDVPSLWYLGLFLIGAFLMRSAGCVYNDMVDSKLDARVARTATRPLASGAITKTNALMTLLVLLSLATCILYQFPVPVWGLGLLSLVLVALYPWMKRITYWPQLFLGLTFNWGVLMGWLTYRSELSLEIFLLYGAGIFWTLGYDTIYAYQDREDDALVGIKSSALAIGDHPRGALSGFYGLMILLLCGVGYLSTLAWPYYVGVFVVALQLLWQILTLDIQTPANCWKRFTSNAEVGLVIFFSIMVGHVLK